MKKRGLYPGLLALALILALAACGGTGAGGRRQKDGGSCAAPGGRDFRKPMGRTASLDHKGPETADDSQQLRRTEPGSGLPPRGPEHEEAGDGEPSGRPGGESRYTSRWRTQSPSSRTRSRRRRPSPPCPSVESASGVDRKFLRFRDRGPGRRGPPDGRGG